MQELLDRMNNAEALSESELTEVVNYVLSQTDQKEAFSVFACLQKNTANLFKVHPRIEKHLLKLARGE